MGRLLFPSQPVRYEAQHNSAEGHRQDKTLITQSAQESGFQGLLEPASFGFNQSVTVSLATPANAGVWQPESLATFRFMHEMRFDNGRIGVGRDYRIIRDAITTQEV